MTGINQHTALDDAERLDWLRLARAAQVGPATFRGLLARYGSPARALEAIPRLARRTGRRITLPDPDDIAREFERGRALDARLLVLADPDYPAALKALDAPPPVLWMRGEGPCLGRDAIAIVGARNASGNGVRFAAMIAADLGGAGLVVASGLARGIDTAAHRGALASGTIAVLAGGLDIVYPPENRQLYAEICAQGAIVSEMPIGFAPVAQHFPRRNRLISGLARGVVVIEAAQHSGSLITARFAAEQGREVFAVPGSPLDPRCRGTNHLIRQGATLTETAEDVLTVIRPMLHRRLAEDRPLAAPERLPDLDDDRAAALRARLVEYLSPNPVRLEDVVADLGEPAADILSTLLDLELAGEAERLAGGLVARR